MIADRPVLPKSLAREFQSNKLDFLHFFILPCGLCIFDIHENMSAKLLKRKLQGNASSAQKKAKTVHLTANDLPWKTVKSRQEAGFSSNMDGMMELEEVEGVEVVYEQNAGGKVARFKVSGVLP